MSDNIDLPGLRVGGADWPKARGPNPKICGIMYHMGMKRIRN